jgi:hypothetical protein
MNYRANMKWLRKAKLQLRAMAEDLRSSPVHRQRALQELEQLDRLEVALTLHQINVVTDVAVAPSTA